ncbi:MAG: sulfite exporter TauE/SafE family protein [Magnetovibrionaceae bacterium]
MIDDPLFYAAAVPAVLIAGISKGGFGGGLGVMAVPLLTLVMEPTLAAAVMLPILCSMDLMGAYAYWRKWDGPTLILLVLSACIGIGLGAAFFHLLDADMIKLMVGVIAIGFALDFVWKKQRGGGKLRSKPNRLLGAFWGGVAGLTSFTAHAGGPPVNVYLLKLGLHKTTYQATTVAFFLLINYVKLVPYTALGLFDAATLGAAAVLLPVAVLGVFAGVKLHDRVPQDLFFKACYIFLFLTGCKLVSDVVF